MAAPVFSRVSSRSANVFWLSVTAEPGAVVRFTTNGREPTPASPVFDVPRLIAERVTVKAKAFIDGRPPSPTTTGHFVVELPQRTTGAELHVVPTMYRNDPSAFLDACLRMDQWGDVLTSTLYFGSSPGIAALTDADLAVCFRAMARHRLQLTIEAGVINTEVPRAADLLARDAPQWVRFIRLGAPLSTIFLQEPWTSTDGSPLAYADVVRETAEWIALVREQFPGIRLILQEAYPFHSGDELLTFVRDVNAAATARGTAPLDGFELDHDWVIPAWSPLEVQRLHTELSAAGMRFSIILWPAGPATTDDCAFGRRIVRQYREIYGTARGLVGEDFTPDMWSVESWSPFPVAVVPESTPCTFMNGAREIAAGL